MPTILKLNYIYSILYILYKNIILYIYRYYRRKLRSKLPTIWTDEKKRMTWHHFFVAGAALSTDEVQKPQNALVWGRQLCTQFSTIEGSLAELFRFWCWQLQKLRLCFWRYQVQKLRKSHRIASFLMLSPSKMEEALQNSFVFKLAHR